MGALPSELVLRCGGVPGVPGAEENEDSKGNFERRPRASPPALPGGLLPRPEPRMIVPRFELEDAVAIGVAARLLLAPSINRPSNEGEGEWVAPVQRSPDVVAPVARFTDISTRKSLLSRCPRKNESKYLYLREGSQIIDPLVI